ncbi:MAG: FitA-like ribbon-helix-helix domain-containing protein [Thermomicrobiales bacterium]
MAALTIRNLDDDVKAKLRIRAAHNGRSMEAEVREILAEAVDEAESADAMLEVVESTNIPTAASYDPDSDMTDEEYARVQQFLAELPEIEDFATAFVRMGEAFGGIELDIPPRTEMPRIPDFSGSEWGADDDQAIGSDAADLSREPRGKGSGHR